MAETAKDKTQGEQPKSDATPSSNKEDDFNSYARKSFERIAAIPALDILSTRNRLDVLVHTLTSKDDTLSGKQALTRQSIAIEAALLVRLYGSEDGKLTKMGSSALALEKAMAFDPKVTPRKQYEAMVKQVWKVAKADLDEYLSRPEIKKIIDNTTTAK